MFNLIKGLEYYNLKGDGKYSNYNVVVDDFIFDDVIYVYSNKCLFEMKAQYAVALIPKSTNDRTLITHEVSSAMERGKEIETDLGEISFVFSKDEKENKKHFKRLVGKIKILNYESEKKRFKYEEFNSD